MSLVEVRLVFSIGLNAERIATAKLDFETTPNASGAELLAMATAARQSWAGGAVGGNLWFPATTDLARVEAFTWQAVQVTDSELTKYPRCAGMTVNPYKRVQLSTPQVDETDVGGTRAGTALPPNCAVVASFRTTLAGRRRRGRCYLPPLAEGDVDQSGAITQAVVDGVKAAMDDVASDIEASVAGMDIDHIVWSHCDNVTEEVTSILVNQRIDTQRRRLGP